MQIFPSIHVSQRRVNFPSSTTAPHKFVRLNRSFNRQIPARSQRSRDHMEEKSNYSYTAFRLCQVIHLPQRQSVTYNA